MKPCALILVLGMPFSGGAIAQTDQLRPTKAISPSTHVVDGQSERMQMSQTSQWLGADCGQLRRPVTTQ